jgi:hypothetical protein
MNRLFWQAAIVAPVLLISGLFANSASAQTVAAEKESVDQTLEQINNYQQLEQSSQSQVTNVNQLRDVSPTDWAYEALRSLVDRYGCISGFPNQTYRGSQPLTRYEFAAGLNSCLNQIERLIASQDSVGSEDLETIKRLTQEFEAELATLGGRVDEIESRTAVLEDNQFSTTTKLNAEAIFALTDAFGDGVDGVNVSDNAQTAFSDRVRLNFDASFYGEDRLRARLEAGNVPNYGDVTGTDSARLAFENGEDNNIELTELHYQFPFKDRITGYVGTTGLGFDDVLNPGNPTLSSSGDGALTRFNRYNPLIYRGTDGAGAGVSVDIIPDKVTATGLYLSDNAEDPTTGEGVFNGSNSAGAQLEFNPTEALNVNATYIRNYQTADSVDQSGGTSSTITEDPFAVLGTDVKANKYGLDASFNLGDRIVLGGFGGYADVEGLADGENPAGEIWTFGANVSFLDLVKEGSQLSIAGGQVPRFSPTNAAATAAGIAGDPTTSYLVEAQYKFPLNDNISITPGAYAIFNPNGDDANDTVYAGVLRTYFKF